MPNPHKYFIIAGESSGDTHGALLMQAIIDTQPDAKFEGIGGKKMSKFGLLSLFPIEKMSVMGFIEVLKHLHFFKQVEKTILQKIKETQPHRIILIDYPGFNLRIAKKVKQQFNIPTTYYISPQIWAWKEKRIVSIKKYVDQMLVIFPFEKQWYADRGMDVKWVGHPYLEEWKKSPKTELKSLLGLNKDKPLITLFPGSRKQELDRHLPVCLEAANRLKNEIPEMQIVLGLSSNLKIQGQNIPEFVRIESTHPSWALEAADAAIVASGTATLEAAIYGTPHVIIYKMNVISWLISKVLIKTKFVGMPNIIADRKIIPELLQSDASAKAISEQIIRIIKPGLARDNTLQKLLEVRDALGDGHASSKAAKLIVSESS